MTGVLDRIHALRRRHRQLGESIAYYEDMVAEQTTQLNRMNKPSEFEDEESGEEEEEPTVEPVPAMTAEELQQEQEEIEELERKKRALEERVSGMERDLGGLMR
jgi:hypothetical protein